MTMITELIRNIQIIAAVIIIILLVFCGIGLYLLNFKRGQVKEKRWAYSHLTGKERLNILVSVNWPMKF